MLPSVVGKAMGSDQEHMLKSERELNGRLNGKLQSDRQRASYQRRRG